MNEHYSLVATALTVADFIIGLEWNFVKDTAQDTLAHRGMALHKTPDTEVTTWDPDRYVLRRI